MKKLSPVVNFDTSVIDEDTFAYFMRDMREISASIKINNDTYFCGNSQKFVVTKSTLNVKRVCDNGNIFNNSSRVVEDFFSVTKRISE